MINLGKKIQILVTTVSRQALDINFYDLLDDELPCHDHTILKRRVIWIFISQSPSPYGRFSFDEAHITVTLINEIKSFLNQFLKTEIISESETPHPLLV